MKTRNVRCSQYSCMHCVHTIQTEVADVQGVQSVKADQTSKMVEIVFDTRQMRPRSGAAGRN